MLKITVRIKHDRLSHLALINKIKIGDSKIGYVIKNSELR